MNEVEQKCYLDLSGVRRSLIDLRLLSSITALSFDHQVYFLMNIFWKRSDLPFFTQVRSQKGEKRGFVYACKQTQLDDFAHEQSIICRQLCGLLASEKEEPFAWKSYSFCFFFFRISNQALLSQMKHLKN